ncbi:hypothetical protein CEUSTIGMA_g9914.t1 [Chlamydomonas eustigma]|uniref:DNA-directed RNA polymerase RBP11-like dimerisation domain-containing protein n=1 Tax=Chlamydomonas eustigma TaxID=1157962 RepID=A0A250XHD6_9CHLO|nr:hypothetical protein CEUSTIGMA_g9914.t1 [Chlamydomonas eustigma]|eukprot:GAX82487.1 hypothetical protein CEUSTIGMA_g9914.t1 [Chlamydomonas eustigma]
MNQPDRYSRFIIPDGVRKVDYKKDEKIADAGTFTIMNEDHTLGNMVRMQLHEDRNVIFAGYRIPHPLESKMQIMIQTNGEKAPTLAMEHALDDLRSEMTSVLSAFDNEASRMRDSDYMHF